MGTPVRTYEYGLDMVEFYGSGLSIIAALLSEPKSQCSLAIFFFFVRGVLCCSPVAYGGRRPSSRFALFWRGPFIFVFLHMNRVSGAAELHMFSIGYFPSSAAFPLPPCHSIGCSPLAAQE